MRKETFIFSGLVLLAVALSVIFSHHGLLDLRRFLVQIEAAKVRTQRLEETNRHLRMQLESLQQKDVSFLERQVRENLGWVKPNELVYVEPKK